MAPTLQGAANIRFCQMSPKTAWNWKNLDRGRPKFYCVDPPLLTTLYLLYWFANLSIAKRLYCRAKCCGFSIISRVTEVNIFYEERYYDEEKVRNLLYNDCVTLEGYQTFCWHTLLLLIGDSAGQSSTWTVTIHKKTQNIRPVSYFRVSRLIR